MEFPWKIGIFRPPMLGNFRVCGRLTRPKELPTLSSGHKFVRHRLIEFVKNSLFQLPTSFCCVEWGCISCSFLFPARFHVHLTSFSKLWFTRDFPVSLIPTLNFRAFHLFLSNLTCKYWALF